MKCITKTCKSAVDSPGLPGYRLPSCAHVYCRACYLELVRRVKLDKATTRCLGCAKGVELYGSMDMAEVLLDADKPDLATDNATFQELESKIQMLTLAIAIAEQQPAEERLRQPRPMTAITQEAYQHPFSAIEVVIPAGADVKLWQRRVREQRGSSAHERAAAARKTKELTVARAQLRDAQAKAAHLKKAVEHAYIKYRKLVVRIAQEEERVNTIKSAACVLAGRTFDASSNQDGLYNFPYRGVARSIQQLRVATLHVKQQITVMTRQYRELENANEEMGRMLTESSHKRELLQVSGAASWDECQARLHDMEILERNSAVINLMAWLPTLCLSSSAIVVGLVAGPQAMGFSFLGWLFSNV
ncbi:hypothetical protein EV121DRAFT_286447 [Schizophyllum commune]